MGWYPITTVVAFLINLSLAILVYRRSRGKRSMLLFANLLAMASVWQGAAFFVNIAKTAEAGLFWNRILHIGAIMVVPAFFHFVWDFTKTKKLEKWFFLVPFVYIGNASLLFLLFSPLLVKSVSRAKYIGYSYTPGPAYVLYGVFFALCAFYGLIAIYRTYKTSKGQKKQKAKYFLLVLLLAILSCLIFFTMSISKSIPILPVDNFIVIIFSITFTYAMLTYKLIDIKIIIAKIFLFFIFSVIFLGSFTLTSSIVWFIFKNNKFGPIISAAIPFILFTSLFPPLRNGILEYIDRLVYGDDYNYRKLTKEASEVLVSTLDLRELLGYLTDTIKQNLKPQRLSLFLKDGHTFKAKTTVGIAAINQKLSQEHPLVTLLENNKKALMFWEFQNENPKAKKIISSLRRLRANVIVPLILKEKLTGFITLDTKESGKSYSAQDLEVLNALASTASIALQNAQLYEEAITDSLTGLYHHKYFQIRIKEEVSRAKRYHYPLSMIMIDIDEFKSVNDKYGHQVGDQVLEELSDLIKQNLRLFDIVARYGGEEFAILLPSIGEETTKNHYKKVLDVAERLRKKVEQAKFSDRKLNLTISLGIAFYNGKDDEITSHIMINEADKQLYRAKQGGRNQVCKVNISKKLLA